MADKKKPPSPRGNFIEEDQLEFQYDNKQTKKKDKDEKKVEGKEKKLLRVEKKLGEKERQQQEKLVKLERQVAGSSKDLSTHQIKKLEKQREKLTAVEQERERICLEKDRLIRLSSRGNLAPGAGTDTPTPSAPVSPAPEPRQSTKGLDNIKSPETSGHRRNKSLDSSLHSVSGPSIMLHPPITLPRHGLEPTLGETGLATSSDTIPAAPSSPAIGGNTSGVGLGDQVDFIGIGKKSESTPNSGLPSRVWKTIKGVTPFAHKKDKKKEFASAPTPKKFDDVVVVKELNEVDGSAGEPKPKDKDKDKDKDVQKLKFSSEDMKVRYSGDCVRVRIEDEDRKKYEIVKFYDTTWSGHKRYIVPHGNGKLKYANGEVIYVGSWKKGFRDGSGEGFWEAQNHRGIYIGSWREGKPEGNGRWENAAFTYTGGFKEGMRHNVGELVRPNQFSYAGEWQDDKKHGYGTAHYPDGTTYEGEWKDDLRSGFGACKYPDGETYTGEWKENWRWGKGTSIHQNGNKFVGNWYKDMRQGDGTLFVSLDQKVYEGGWWRNKRHGKGTYYYLETGEKYTGDWFLGKEDGEGEMVFSDGSHYQGSWLDGNRAGVGVLEYANGDKYVGEWVAGKREGTQGAYLYRDYGQFQGMFKNDIIDGFGDYCTFGGKSIMGEFKFDVIEDEEGEYTGLTMHGNRWGRGVQVYKNGDRYEGEWRIGKRSGYGILDTADGCKYVGFWVGGETSRFGTYTWPSGQKFVGRCLRGKKHGPGTMVLPNGDTIEAEWVDDQLTNRVGIVRYATGEVYHGPLFHGKPNGVGQLSIPLTGTIPSTNASGNASQQAPLVKLGTLVGPGTLQRQGSVGLAKAPAPPVGRQGTLISSNEGRPGPQSLAHIRQQSILGSSSVGQPLQRNSSVIRPRGAGAATTPDSPKDSERAKVTTSHGAKNVITLVREFADGALLDGFGLAHYPNGDHYTGYFVGRRRQGLGQLTSPEVGVTYVGHWKYDEYEGVGEQTFENGDVYRGHFKNGEKHGFGSETFETGGTYFGTWKLGQRHACGIFKWPDNVFMFREYQMGEMVAKRHVDQDFAKQRIETFGCAAIEETIRVIKSEVSQFKPPSVGVSER